MHGGIKRRWIPRREVSGYVADGREVTVQAVAQPAVRVPEERVRKLALDKHLRTDGRAHSVGELRTNGHDNAVVLASVLRAICRSQG